MAPTRTDVFFALLNVVAAKGQAGKDILEAIVPITYFTRLSSNNGGITAEEAHQWLRRLEWEGHENTLGTLNFYVVSGRKPESLSNAVHVNQVTAENVPRGLAAEVTALVNETYGISDTGVTLSSLRIPEDAVVGMIQRGELFTAISETTGELLGCIQCEVKGTGVNAGLPDLSGDGVPLGEFSMLAVKAYVANCS